MASAGVGNNIEWWGGQRGRADTEQGAGGAAGIAPKTRKALVRLAGAALVIVAAAAIVAIFLPNALHKNKSSTKVKTTSVSNAYRTSGYDADYPYNMAPDKAPTPSPSPTSTISGSNPTASGTKGSTGTGTAGGSSGSTGTGSSSGTSGSTGSASTAIEGVKAPADEGDDGTTTDDPDDDVSTTDDEEGGEKEEPDPNGNPVFNGLIGATWGALGGVASAVCYATTGKELRHMAEGTTCTLIVLTRSSIQPYTLAKTVTVRGIKVIVGNPIDMPVINAYEHHIERAFAVAEGAYLDLRHVVIIRGYGRIFGEEPPLMGKLIAGACVTIYPGGTFMGTGIIFRVEDQTIEQYLYDVETALNGFIYRVFGGYVLQLGGYVQLNGCHFITYRPFGNPYLDNGNLGRDIAVVAGILNMFGCMDVTAQGYSNTFVAGTVAAVLGGALVWTGGMVVSVYGLQNVFGAGTALFVGGGAMILTGVPYVTVVGALNGGGFGAFSVGAGVGYFTGFHTARAWGVAAIYGYGHTMSVGAGVMHFIGNAVSSAANQWFWAGCGGTAAQGVGDVYLLGVQQVRAVVSQINFGLGFWYSNGAGSLQNIGFTAASVQVVRAYIGLGGESYMGDGVMLYIGTARVIAQVVSYIEGLGTYAYLGAGGMLLVETKYETARLVEYPPSKSAPAYVVGGKVVLAAAAAKKNFWLTNAGRRGRLLGGSNMGLMGTTVDAVEEEVVVEEEDRDLLQVYYDDDEPVAPTPRPTPKPATPKPTTAPAPITTSASSTSSSASTTTTSTSSSSSGASSSGSSSSSAAVPAPFSTLFSDALGGGSNKNEILVVDASFKTRNALLSPALSHRAAQVVDDGDATSKAREGLKSPALSRRAAQVMGDGSSFGSTLADNMPTFNQISDMISGNFEASRADPQMFSFGNTDLNHCAIANMYPKTTDHDYFHNSSSDPCQQIETGLKTDDPYLHLTEVQENANPPLFWIDRILPYAEAMRLNPQGKAPLPDTGFIGATLSVSCKPDPKNPMTCVETTTVRSVLYGLLGPRGDAAYSVSVTTEYIPTKWSGYLGSYLNYDQKVVQDNNAGISATNDCPLLTTYKVFTTTHFDNLTTELGATWDLLASEKGEATSPLAGELEDKAMALGRTVDVCQVKVTKDSQIRLPPMERAPAYKPVNSRSRWPTIELSDGVSVSQATAIYAENTYFIHIYNFRPDSNVKIELFQSLDTVGSEVTTITGYVDDGYTTVDWEVGGTTADDGTRCYLKAYDLQLPAVFALSQTFLC